MKVKSILKYPAGTVTNVLDLKHVNGRPKYVRRNDGSIIKQHPFS